MPTPQKLTFVFVHGYSVTNLNTYGELPVRLVNEGAVRNFDIRSEEIHLGRYISFNDEVRLDDISRAFQTAVKEQLSGLLKRNERFICITHSTGGPVIRNWWHNFYQSTREQCPMSHLIMMAPANNGSALAQLGKGRLSRVKAWVEQVEPGQGVLDWLELGSEQAWELNFEWIKNGSRHIKPEGCFPFVLTGQAIDRKLYDNLNPYTGEAGSDGVVRSSAANINGAYIRLVQEKEKSNFGSFAVNWTKQAPESAFRIIRNKSHSKKEMGIIASVRKETGENEGAELVELIFECAGVKDLKSYKLLCKKFELETQQVQKDEQRETVRRIIGMRYFIHDRYSQVIFKVRDADGNAVSDFDILLTAGSRSNPNHLPEGFLADRQRNMMNPEAITYYFNYDVMQGTEAVRDDKGEIIRPASKGAKMLGLKIFPRPTEGFVRYHTCEIRATEHMLKTVLQPNCTTLIEIVLQRIVSKEVFRMEGLVNGKMPSKRQGNFKKARPGSEIVE